MGRFSVTVFTLVILISYSKTSRRTFQSQQSGQKEPLLGEALNTPLLAPNHKDYSLF